MHCALLHTGGTHFLTRAAQAAHCAASCPLNFRPTAAPDNINSTTGLCCCWCCCSGSDPGAPSTQSPVRVPCSIDVLHRLDFRGAVLGAAAALLALEQVPPVLVKFQLRDDDLGRVNAHWHRCACMPLTPC